MLERIKEELILTAAMLSNVECWLGLRPHSFRVEPAPASDDWGCHGVDLNQIGKPLFALGPLWQTVQDLAREPVLRLGPFSNFIRSQGRTRRIG